MNRQTRREDGPQLVLPYVLPSMAGQSAVQSTSLPHTSQPGAGRRANSSTLGRSPMSASMRRLASSGFLLCSSRLDMISWWMFRACRLGWPLVASRHSSALAWVQLPGPQKTVPALGLSLIQTKAVVLYRNPHASMTPHASHSLGRVIQRNRAQSVSANSATGRAMMSSIFMVG